MPVLPNIVIYRVFIPDRNHGSPASPLVSCKFNYTFHIGNTFFESNENGRALLSDHVEQSVLNLKSSVFTCFHKYHISLLRKNVIALMVLAIPFQVKCLYSTTFVA